jgi:ornithine cyclodeaminase/alanine dehydrogenase-like protein (mu-crystallin family)
MLVFSSEEIKSSVSMVDAIECVAKGFSDFDDGFFHMPQRSVMDINGATVLTMPCYRKGGKYFVIKVVTVYNSTVFLFDSNTGALVASLDGDSITAIRTGAASGLATKFFSSPKSETLAVYGTGVQAHTQVEAVISCRPIKSVFIYSRNLKSAKKFSDYIYNSFSIDAYAGEQEDLKNIDIICTATPSKDSLFELCVLKSGVHINAVGSFKPNMKEIHSDIINASEIIVDSLEACKKEAGDLIQAKEKSNWDFNHISMQLGQASKNEKKLIDISRNNTVFKSVGLAFQDLVIVEYIMDNLSN